MKEGEAKGTVTASPKPQARSNLRAGEDPEDHLSNSHHLTDEKTEAQRGERLCRFPKPAGKARPSCHPISANEGRVLPEQEEEPKQLEGRVKADNYTSQEAGFLQPRRGHKIRCQSWTPAGTHMHKCTRVHAHM